jgi:hypothetical protein
MPPAPPRLLQFRPQPRPIGVQFGVTVCHSPQSIEHAGDILRHADLIGLAPLQNALDVKGLRQNASSTFPSPEFAVDRYMTGSARLAKP